MGSTLSGIRGKHRTGRRLAEHPQRVEAGASRPFAGDTAAFYKRYRRAYPADLIVRLARFSRGGRGRLLDLGCGTGQLALQLAGDFSEVVGMDPEPDMLHEAKRAAAQRGIANLKWIKGSSQDLPRLAPAIGRFDLVTIATAFH